MIQALLIKEALEKLASQGAPKRSLAMRESRRNRQGAGHGRRTAAQSIQDDHRRDNSAVGTLGKGQRFGGSRHGAWMPLPDANTQFIVTR